MKTATPFVTLVMLLASKASAQATTISSDADADVVTSYFSVCPSDMSTTVTVDTTTTICPGPGCGGHTTVYVGPIPITTIGSDGRTTTYVEDPWTMPCPCAGGICDATYTITRECPCSAPPETTTCPEGFTVTAVPCDECAKSGGPATVTVTTPMPNGPYASQTPAMGTPYNGVQATAGASAYASAGANGAAATAGSNAAASANSGNNSNNGMANDMTANANSGANANASGSSASNGNANAGSDTGSNNEQNGPAAPVAPAPAAASPIYATGGSGDYTTNSTNVTPPIEPFQGTANKAIYAISTVAASVIGCLAFFL